MMVFPPDSCDGVCIENSNVTSGHDAISLKSGWDEYGITCGRPTTNVHIKRIVLQSFTGSALSLGSEMSGGISQVTVESMRVVNSVTGVALLTSKGRGGYMKEVVVSNVSFRNVVVGIRLRGGRDWHADGEYDPEALPVVEGIGAAGSLSGIAVSPFTSICLRNVSLGGPWACTNMWGSSEEVSPVPCVELQRNDSVCYDSPRGGKGVAVV